MERVFFRVSSFWRRFFLFFFILLGLLGLFNSSSSSLLNYSFYLYNSVKKSFFDFFFSLVFTVLSFLKILFSWFLEYYSDSSLSFKSKPTYSCVYFFSCLLSSFAFLFLKSSIWLTFILGWGRIPFPGFWALWDLRKFLTYSQSFPLSLLVLSFFNLSLELILEIFDSLFFIFLFLSVNCELFPSIPEFSSYY